MFMTFTASSMDINLTQIRQDVWTTESLMTHAMSWVDLDADGKQTC